MLETLGRDLEDVRRRLLDTGTRNRLIHVNRAHRRANCLNIINERSDDIFDILRVNSQKMRFKAMGKDRGEDGEELQLAAPDEDLEPGGERHTDKFLETPLGPEALARRLLRLANDAKTAEEEQGLNILYLALGFLRWREAPGSDVEREAPLILLPVTLTRNARTSSHDIQAREDDLSTNLPLQQRLRQDFGIILPEIDETEVWRPSEYFAQVEQAISVQPSWSLDVDGMQLGFFSFAKLLMHRDLDSEAWPEGALTQNSLLASLLREGFEADNPHFGPQDKLDAILEPADIIQVIDADASQTKVIEEVRRGSSLVVQGPPGTGKSQTITNIIAAAAHDHKSVLFVAEKMAALSVVHDRLVKAKLQNICLELHSRTANKKALAQELGRTLHSSGSSPLLNDNSEKLKASRDELNDIADLLHQPQPENGESLFQTMSEIIGFIGAGTKPPPIPLDGLESLSHQDRMRVCESIQRFREALERSGSREQHSYRGTKELSLQPTDLVRLEEELAKAKEAIAKLQEETQKIAEQLRCPAPQSVSESLAFAAAMRELASVPTGAASRIPVLYEHSEDSRMVEALQAGRDWSDAKGEVEGIFVEAAWSIDVSAIRLSIARGCSSIFARWFGSYRRACGDFATLLSAPLPKTPSERLRLVDNLLEVQKHRRRLQEEEGWLASSLGDLWRGEQTPFGELLELSEWLGKIKQGNGFAMAEEILTALQEVSDPVAVSDLLRQLAQEVLEKMKTPVRRLDLNVKRAGAGKDLETSSLSSMEQIFARMHASKNRYVDWVTLERSIAVMRENGASAIVEAVLENRLDAVAAIDAFFYACAEARWNAARKSCSELPHIESLDRHDCVARFREMERERIEATKELILHRHREQIPRGSTGEMGIILGEINRKRGHMPIRRLMERASSMVQRIKPVVLMSPISVAQFLPPGQITFDLLVIDEASQVRPEDALGVIARAKQIVVIGDQKQLPPTSFFDRLGGEEEDDDDDDDGVGASAGEMESILSLCEARGMRRRMLEWHYRSRDPSLIRVSNAEFYENSLVLPPSPLERDENYGLGFRRVAGCYSRGGSRSNKIEAEIVVKAIAQHARERPDSSLGVVTFSKSQADMMREILEYERRQDSVLDKFLREGQREDVFVKNIENVQGDERDVIFISVGYGPQEPNGRLASMNFGPINKEGGERRLNVLFSRARSRCEVFASFDPEDMDVRRLSSEGPRVLKRFLEFAKTGSLAEHRPTGLDADSPFEEDVARVIRSLGYEADAQVGSAGFRIDIGVRHPDRPGQYIVAVECDGAMYHSALWARERDRLRQEILENLGWRFHRIWSTDWFHRRAQEIERLKEALQEARTAALDGIVVPGANAGGRVLREEAQEQVSEVVRIDPEPFSVPLYKRADIVISSPLEPHEVPLQELGDVIARIIRAEGPLHIDEVTRRVSSAFGKTRSGKRISDAVARATKEVLRCEEDLLQIGSFVLTVSQQESPPVRNRSGEEGSLVRAEYLPPMEVRAAREIVVRENGEMSESDVIRAIGQLLGFRRVGKELQDRIAAALSSS